jgi:2-aminoethylphosphonate-pyruvate transaminase
MLYIVHHETTSGLINPLKKIGALAKKYNLLFMVDGVSSIAGEELKLKSWGIDLIIGSANKCIRGVAGLSFVLVSEKFIKRLKLKGPKKPYYLNLYQHLIREEAGQTPFTPAVQNFYAFHEALLELLKEGVRNRIQHYKKISLLLRDGLRKMGFKIYVADKIASNTMTTVYLPQGISYKWLHRECKRRGYVIYGALGSLREKAFRLGTVGLITQKDISSFLKVLDRILPRKAR